MAKCVWAARAVGGRADGKRHREQVASGQLRAVKCQAAEVRFMLSVRDNWESDVVGLCALGRLTCGHTPIPQAVSSPVQCEKPAFVKVGGHGLLSTWQCSPGTGWVRREARNKPSLPEVSI